MTVTNVPAPAFTPTGFVVPQESIILAGVQQDMNTAFGGNLNFGTTQGSQTNATPQGQLAASLAAIIGNVDDTFLFYSTQTDPAFAEGRFQDALGRIYFMERIPSTPTMLTVQCIGAVGAVIPVRSLVVDANSNQYASTQAATIGVGGTVGVQFAAIIPGFLSVPSSISIYQSVLGWDTATLIFGVQGQNAESRAAFETRRGLSTAANSAGSLPSILGAVLSVPGVTQAFVYENTTGSPLAFEGVTLAPHSVYVAAYGGSSAAVAQAIWSRKAPGCGYAAGNTVVTVQDTSPGYFSPFPSYQVTYQIPNPLPLQFAVSVVNSIGVPGNATSLVQQAIVNAVAGQPNAQGIVDGPQSTIGAKIWASRFIPSVSALGSWAQGQVISIQIGSGNNPDAATAFGSCGGTSLIVTSLLSGVISAGQTLSFTNGSGVVLPGTTIISQVSGSVGGTGTYTIGTAQTINGGSSNLLLFSNTFSNAAWTASNSTVSGSAGTSPDGTNDSWLWQRSSVASAFFIQTITRTATAQVYTFSLSAKLGSGSFLALYMDDTTNANQAQVSFNVSTGVVSIPPSVLGAFTNASATIQPIVNGFYRCSLTVTVNAVTGLRVAWCGNASNVGIFTTDTLSNTTIQVFGAQLEQASAPSPYIQTTATPVIISMALLEFSTPDQTFVQVQLNQIPTVAAQDVVVTFV